MENEPEFLKEFISNIIVNAYEFKIRYSKKQDIRLKFLKETKQDLIEDLNFWIINEDDITQDGNSEFLYVQLTCENVGNIFVL